MKVGHTYSFYILYQMNFFCLYPPYWISSPIHHRPRMSEKKKIQINFSQGIKKHPILEGDYKTFISLFHCFMYSKIFVPFFCLILFSTSQGCWRISKAVMRLAGSFCRRHWIKSIASKVTTILSDVWNTGLKVHILFSSSSSLLEKKGYSPNSRMYRIMPTDHTSQSSL